MFQPRSRYPFITIGGGKDRFHYLATKGGELFLVEETIQP
jgi:hypothetical protein